LNMKSKSAYEHIVDELHKPARIQFKRRHVIVKGLHDLYQADLIEMIPYSKTNKGFKYILVVIDVFSKYVWAEPLKSKSAVEVTKAMKKILKSKPSPKNLQTDQGKEFYNKEFNNLMQTLNINHYSTYSSMKASVVERVNRTLKSIMFRGFTLQGNYKWLQLLPIVVDKYNNTIHSTIKMKPIDVSKSNEQALLNTVYNKIKLAPKTTKFNVGDHVRISKHRSVFKKGYLPNWTTEIFTVYKTQYTNPTTYILQDSDGEVIHGGFYEHELQATKYPDIYLLEKVIRKKNKMLFVKFRGLKANSWIKESDLYE